MTISTTCAPGRRRFPLVAIALSATAALTAVLGAAPAATPAYASSAAPTWWKIPAANSLRTLPFAR